MRRVGSEHPGNLVGMERAVLGVGGLPLPTFPPTALASHDYILKIVPTVYEDMSGHQRFSYQYTVANKVLPCHGCARPLLAEHGNCGCPVSRGSQEMGCWH